MCSHARPFNIQTEEPIEVVPRYRKITSLHIWEKASEFQAGAVHLISSVICPVVISF